MTTKLGVLLWNQASDWAPYEAGARRDFARYLTAYPAGAAAPDARRWLAARAKTKIDEPRARR